MELAKKNASSGQGGPFGAVLVKENVLISTGVNQVTQSPDPSAHAEIMAIRHAAKQLGTHDLSGCVLYSSCEPCVMCMGAILWARIESVIYAASKDIAARFGFDDLNFWEQVQGGKTPSICTHQTHSDQRVPFEQWQQDSDKILY
ncbi:MAG: tRNA-specific adenosine deaminase [Actinobacteria bacterium]|nr:tRNA-specific adenosine deaminase [Actinomycetota bacterium]